MYTSARVTLTGYEAVSKGFSRAGKGGDKMEECLPGGKAFQACIWRKYLLVMSGQDHQAAVILDQNIKIGKTVKATVVIPSFASYTSVDMSLLAVSATVIQYSVKFVKKIVPRDFSLQVFFV